MTCGADPRDAWDYTPGELLEYIRGYRERERRKGYFGYNLAVCIAGMLLGKRKPEPWQSFPGLIEHEEMDDDAIWGILEAWGGDAGGSGKAESENTDAAV